MADYKYKFSIVTAVYNVELYVAETIESIIAQDIGFENIQLILVDDGTPDNSGAICDEYAKKYPDNIVVVHKENGGVSSARNAGLELAEGKYVNFIDSDDYFDSNTFSEIWNFFEANYDKVDAVAIPLMYFEGKSGNHLLNYKFTKENRVVDLEKEPDCIQMHVASVFIKREALSGITFDTKLAYAEDALFVQQVMMNKRTLGLVSSCCYRYRVRVSGTASAIQSGAQKPQWYIPVLKYFHYNLIETAIAKIGYVPRYIQYVLMYDLKWRFRRTSVSNDVLSDDESEEYLDAIKNVVRHIDDDIIMAEKNIFREHKIRILKLKYGKEPEKIIKENDVIFQFSPDAIFKVSKNLVNIDFIDIENSVLKIEGFISQFNLDYGSKKVFLESNGKRFYCKIVERNKQNSSLDEVILENIGFYCEVPLEKKITYIFNIGVEIDGVPVVLKRHAYKYFSPITNTIRNSYCRREDWIICEKNTRLFIMPATIKRKIKFETILILRMILKKYEESRKHAFLRMWYDVCKHFKRKPIWLISDRPAIAGDNGEAFFMYMRKNHPEINSVFMIDSKCDDYKRICKIGPTVQPNSFKHKLYTLLCDYAISSQGENLHFDPFDKMHNFFRDITVQKPFVFLQHGITMNDISGWLNRYNKNIYGFVTASKYEHNSILEYDYSYTEKQVWLAGFARFDRLYDKSEKNITIMPTWRKYLSKYYDKETNKWVMVDEFAESDYYQFFNSLINNDKLISTAKKCGYKLVFVPHPIVRPHMDIFDKNDDVEFSDSNVSYTEIYAKSDLVITDYSSAVFDFAYLRKPVIYTHFDSEDFFGGKHTIKPGYFNFERDGFGEVEYDLEATINRIVEYMENGCRLKDMYRERIDDFFAFNDKNNCQRIYEKLIEGRK